MINDWNPKLYSQFEKQRTQPVKDLISTIEIDSVKRILDVGCGAGNSTEQLLMKWRDAEIIGIDSSPNMIRQAKERLSGVEFQLADANDDLSHLGKFDIVFSNAVIQWLPNHKELIKKLFSLLKCGGVLAIQIPDVRKMFIQRAIIKTAKCNKWSDKFSDESPLNMNFLCEYYDMLIELKDEMYLWETNYYHVMQNHESIIEWYKSTGMKPYLEALDCKEEEIAFTDEVLRRVKKYYKTQSDGKVIFPFKRLFIVAYKK